MLIPSYLQRFESISWGLYLGRRQLTRFCKASLRWAGSNKRVPSTKPGVKMNANHAAKCRVEPKRSILGVTTIDV